MIKVKFENQVQIFNWIDVQFVISCIEECLAYHCVKYSASVAIACEHAFMGADYLEKQHSWGWNKIGTT